MRCEKKEWTKTRRDTQTPQPEPHTTISGGKKSSETRRQRGVISRLIPVMKQTAELAGFEVVGRITLRDKSTGKEWK